MSMDAKQRRIPRDEFEVLIFRRHIEAAAARWYNEEQNINISVGETPDEHGAHGLYVWEWNRANPMKIMHPEGAVRGKVWLAENEHPVSEAYRVQVWHQVEGQEPNHGVGPLLPWRMPV